MTSRQLIIDKHPITLIIKLGASIGVIDTNDY